MENFLNTNKKKNKQIISTLTRYLKKDEDKQSASSASDFFLKDTSSNVQTKTQHWKMQFPSVDVKIAEEEKFEENVVSFQSALRGKAIRKLMEEGINSCYDLIDELKTVEKIEKYNKEEKDLYAKENFDSRKIDSYIDSIQGKCVSDLLEKLSDELEKYEEERKIAVMVKFAERERRLKECKEKGKRQAELLLREKEDFLFNEIMGLNNQTVDSYLEDILGNAVNEVSKEEALKRTKQKAEKINDIYDALEKDDEHDKMIIKDLVGNFIIPYVDEQRGLEWTELKQKKKEYVSNFATQAVLSKINEAF